MQMQHNYQFIKQEADDTTASDTSNSDPYEKIMTSDGKKLHQCTYPGCGKAFRYKSEISRHLVIHFQSRPYQCSFKGCKKTFKRNDALDNHFKIHAKNLPFACEFPGCDEKFTTKAGLKYHCLKHNNEKPFKCTFVGCHKSFLTASQLKQHQKAFVSHNRIFTKQQVEEDGEKSYTDSPSTEFYSPIQKHTHYNDESYFPHQEKQEEVTHQNLDQNKLQSMLSYVLKENSVLESKLKFCDKLISSFMDKYSVKLEGNDTRDDSLLWKAPTASNTFFQHSDSAILDYLRERTGDRL